ncbi:uncharacterized protein LOC131629778 isoform X1 [Vicia villosa]|uniref:uncharacterized protein LOC131629778 isoform X1 n=1 Tax=Vicia villosa TaxID=3911 RepID=UPI00273B719F|nr:uncharacterized protein LOC131629778 isoform X1 [Vicia villosa]
MAAQAQTLKVYPSSTRLQFSYPHSNFNQPRFSSFSFRSPRLQPISCSASNVKPKKHSPSSSTKNKNLNNNHNNNKNNNKSDAEARDSNSASDSSPPHTPTQLPRPPAGFVVDDTGKLLTANNNERIATLVDPANNLPLKCVIRRVFTSSEGEECLLLSPLDMPVYVLQSTGDGWSEVSYEELEPLLPAAAFALAKLRIHLVYSGYCYTARGSLFYSEEDVFEFHAEGKGGGLATEGVKLTRFNEDGAHYMIYTPSDPLVFVAVKNANVNLWGMRNRCSLVKHKFILSLCRIKMECYKLLTRNCLKILLSLAPKMKRQNLMPWWWRKKLHSLTHCWIEDNHLYSLQ